MKKQAVVIDNRVGRLEFMEDVISRVDPHTQCISFVFGDEAIDMINHEMVDAPSHIFIDTNLKRTSISKCLKTLRSNSRLDSCCITVLSDTMPTAVADAYCNMGADFAFTTPLTMSNGVEMLQCVLPAVRSKSAHARVDHLTAESPS